MLSYTGLLDGYPEEYVAMNSFTNHTSDVNNVSVVFKKFKIQGKINIFHQGKNLKTFTQSFVY